MAKAQESLQKLVARWRGKGAQLFLIGMVALLAVRMALFGFEAGGGSLPVVEPTLIQLTAALTPESETYKSVIRLTNPWPEFDASKYRLLAVNNMFDPKRVMDAAQIEKRANEIYSEGLVLFQQGRLPEARAKIDEALSLQSNHAKARELRPLILERLGIREDSPATQAMTTTGTTPAAPTNAPAAPAAPAVPAAGAGPGGPAAPVPPGAPPAPAGP